MKKPLFICAITLVIAGLLITSAAISVPQRYSEETAKEKSNEQIKLEKQRYYNSIKAISSKKLEEQRLTMPTEKTVVANTDMSKELATLPGQGFGILQTDDAEKPAIESDGNGNMLLGYEYHNATEDLIWYAGYDNGYKPTGWVVSWPIPGAETYPSLDYWGQSPEDLPLMMGTFVTPPELNSGGSVHRTEFNGTNITTSPWTVMWTTNWTGYGWYGMKMSDIACDNSQEVWEYGFCSLVTSSTYDSGSGPVGVDVCHITYSTGPAQSTISWLVGLEDCGTTMCAIDKGTSPKKWTYAVYDHFDSDFNQWELTIRQDDFADWDGWFDGCTWYFNDPNVWIRDPAVAVYDDKFCILTEIVNISADPTDTDIICWYDENYSGEICSGSMNISVVAGSMFAEGNPKVAHVSGDTFFATFTLNQTLFYSISTNAGVNWTPPAPFSNASTDQVPEEYRVCDIEYGAEWVAWEYIPIGPLFEGRRIHYANIIWGPDCLCGDDNNDGQVTISDVVYLINYLFRGGPPPIPDVCCGDANGDGQATISDAVYMINYLFRGGPPPVDDCCN
jgi:hypothetical protein